MNGLNMRAFLTIVAATFVVSACGGNPDDHSVSAVQGSHQLQGSAPLSSAPSISTVASTRGADSDSPLFDVARSIVSAPIIYSTTGGPIPNDERAKHVRIGANVTPLPDWKRPSRWEAEPNGIVISFGATHVGPSAVRVEEYLRPHIDDVWESQGYANEPTEDIPGLPTFSDQPVLRIAENTSDEHVVLALAGGRYREYSITLGQANYCGFRCAFLSQY